MRPPKLRQSALRAPLNRILGTEANVRVLRAVTLEPEPLTRSELARRAGLEVNGTHLATNRLLAEGILRRVGAGARQQVVLEEVHPLAPSIRGLFKAESERVERLLEGLRNVAKGLSEDVDSAWIQGPFATGEDRHGDPLRIAVLTRTSATARLSKALRQAVSTIEKSEDVTIDTEIYTRPDLVTLRPEEAKALSDVVPLFGPPPAVFTEAGREASAVRNLVVHSDRDFEHRLLAKEIALRLRREPARRRRALEYIAKRLKDASPQEKHELEEWQAILESSSNARLERFLLDPGERATRLRQTLPFIDMLSADEREQLLSSLRTE